MNRIIQLALLAMVLACPSRSAAAQFYPWSTKEPEFASEAFDEWSHAIAGMTDDLCEAMRGVHTLYMEAYRDGYASFIGAYNDEADIDRKIDVHSAWLVKRDSLRQGVLDDLRALLTDAMTPAWESLDTSLRRKRVESMIRENLYGGQRVDFDLLARAERATLNEEDRERIAPLLDAYRVQRDALYRRIEPELRDLLFEVQHAGRRAIRDESAAAAFRAAWDKVHAYLPAFRDPVERMDEQIMRLLSPEGQLAWRMSANEKLDPAVYGESPVDRVRATLPDVVAELDDAARIAIQNLVNDFEERRAAFRVKIMRATDEWIASGAAQKASDERDALLRQSNEERNPTIDFNAPYLDNPRIPLVNDLLALELTTLRELDALLPADVQKSMPVEARVLLRWGRLAPER